MEANRLPRTGTGWDHTTIRLIVSWVHCKGSLSNDNSRTSTTIRLPAHLLLNKNILNRLRKSRNSIQAAPPTPLPRLKRDGNRYSLFLDRHISSHGIGGVGNASDFVFQDVQKLSCGWVHLSIGGRACDAGGISNAKRTVPQNYR